MTRLHLLFASLVLCLAYSTAHPCSCHRREAPDAFGRAKAVFLGRMLGGTEIWERKRSDGNFYQLEAGSVRFFVEEVFKGQVSGEVVVNVSSMKGTSCGTYGFSRNKRYLVYAYSNDKDATVLSTGVCTRTAAKNSYYAQQDLDFLRNLPPPGTGGTLQGTIHLDRHHSFPDVKVNIRSADNQSLSVITDQAGKFEVKKLKPGKYSVEVEFPGYYTSESKFEEVTIEDFVLTEVYFASYLDGARFSGTLVDRDGQGLKQADLCLNKKDADKGKESCNGFTGEDGAFSFKGVQPGEYVLYLTLWTKKYKVSKPFYYPGTFEPEKATIFKGGLGEKVERLKFRAPEEFKRIGIEGQVLWADGRPAANANVALRCSQGVGEYGLFIGFGLNSTLTDENGRFRIEGLTSMAYQVEAWSEKPTVRHAPPIKLAPTVNLKNLMFILSEEGRADACGN